MSFDVFENIFTASDPAGGRAIKVSALAGIDNAESYYTQNDPAGGRAIKVKIIAGGVSTGTLQVAGGVALDNTARNITDSATPTANVSPLFLSRGNMELRRNVYSDNYILTVNGKPFENDAYVRINSVAAGMSMLELSYGTGYVGIGSLKANSTWGVGLASGSGYPVKFFVNGETLYSSAEFDTAGVFNTYRGIYLKDQASTGNSIISFRYGPSDDEYGYISANSTNFEVSSKSLKPLRFSTGTTSGAFIIDEDGTTNTIGSINVGTSLKINGANGDGHIHLKHQNTDSSGNGNTTVLFANIDGNLKWKNDNLYYTTLQTHSNTADAVYVFPLNGGTLAALNVSQTFTSTQSFTSGLSTNLGVIDRIELPNQVSAPTGTVGRTSIWADSSGRLNWRPGTGFSRTFDATSITADRVYTLPNATTTLAGLSVAQTFTSTQTVGIASTGTSILSGLSVQASTAATSVATTQYSPFLSLVGNAWNSTSTTSVNVGFRMYALPVGGGTPAGSMILESSNDGFSVSNQQLSISTGGVFTFRQFVALGFASSGIMNIMNQNQLNVTRVNFGPNNASTTPALAVVTTSATGDTLSAVDSRTTGAQAVFLRGKLSTNTAYVNTTVTPTGYLVIFDSTGTSYRIPAVAGA